MSLLNGIRQNIRRIPNRSFIEGRCIPTSHKNPFEKNELLSRIGGQSVRFSHQQSQRERQDLLESLKNEKWFAVYRYPGVRFAVLLARAKLIQTIASVFYLPYSTFQFVSGYVDATWYYTCASLAVIAPVILIVFSRYLNRLIGVIAMNETNDFVRVGYLTFWGSRKNLYLELSDVVSLSEVCDAREMKMAKFMWFSGGSKFLYLPIKHAEIVDEQRAEILFGDLTPFNHKMN